MARTLAWKYWFIRRETLPDRVAIGDNTEYVVEVGIRLYEGDTTTEIEPDPDWVGSPLNHPVVPVTRYRLLERISGQRIPARLRPYVSVQYSDGAAVVVIKRGDLEVLITDTALLTARLNQIIL